MMAEYAIWQDAGYFAPTLTEHPQFKGKEYPTIEEAKAAVETLRPDIQWDGDHSHVGYVEDFYHEWKRNLNGGKSAYAVIMHI